MPIQINLCAILRIISANDQKETLISESRLFSCHKMVPEKYQVKFNCIFSGNFLNRATFSINDITIP